MFYKINTNKSNKILSLFYVLYVTQNILICANFYYAAALESKLTVLVTLLPKICWKNFLGNKAESKSSVH